MACCRGALGWALCDLGDVDAYATAVYAMGVDGLTWLTIRHPDHHGFVVTRDGRTFETPGFAQLRAGGRRGVLGRD